jgi:hypothetical protein
MATRKRRTQGHIEERANGSFRVIVYAGRDPLTGKDRRLRKTEADRRAANPLASLMPVPDPSQRDPATPYERIAADLRARVVGGEYTPGTPLPTMTELARHHHVTLGTAQRAVAVLRQEGLIEVSRGRRAIVCR